MVVAPTGQLLLRLVLGGSDLGFGVTVEQELALPGDAVLVRQIEVLDVLLDEALVLQAPVEILAELCEQAGYCVAAEVERYAEGGLELIFNEDMAGGKLDYFKVYRKYCG